LQNSKKLIKISNYLQFSNGRTSPSRIDSGKYPVYGSNGKIGYSNLSNAENGTTIIGRVGSYCGSTYYSSLECWITDNAIKAVPKVTGNPRYFFYLLSTLNLNGMRTGSGQPLLNQEILNSIEVKETNKEDRDAIAHILGTLDDKIELLRQMNETLEAMARALFQSWFVDFDLVRKKANCITTGFPK